MPTRRKRFVRRLQPIGCLSAALAALPACSNAPSGAGVAASSAPPTVAASAVAPAPTAPEPAPVEAWPAVEPPGPLYVLTEGGQIEVLDVDGKTKQVATLPHADGLHLTTDRGVIASVRNGATLSLYRLDGLRTKPLPPLTGVYDSIFYGVDARGDVAAVVTSDMESKKVRVSVLDGKAWKSEDVPLPISSADAVAVGDGDEVWIAGLDGAAVRSGGAWKQLATPEPASNWSSRGFGLAGGNLVVHVEERGEWRELARKGDELQGVGAPLDWSTTGLARNGIALIETGQDEVRARHGSKSVFLPTPWRVGDASVIDGAYRLWTVVDNGLAVVDLQNEKVLATYPQGAKELPDFKGPVRLAVVGGGPALPGKVSTAVASKVTGTIMVNGKPLAKVSIRICPDPSMATRDDPCALSKPELGADTDENGVFVMKDVPNGKYGLTFMTKMSNGGTQWVTERGTFEVSGTGDVRVEPRAFTMTELPY